MGTWNYFSNKNISLRKINSAIYNDKGKGYFISFGHFYRFINRYTVVREMKRYFTCPKFRAIVAADFLRWPEIVSVFFYLWRRFLCRRQMRICRGRIGSLRFARDLIKNKTFLWRHRRNLFRAEMRNVKYESISTRISNSQTLKSPNRFGVFVCETSTLDGRTFELNRRLTSGIDDELMLEYVVMILPTCRASKKTRQDRVTFTQG